MLDSGHGSQREQSAAARRTLAVAWRAYHGGVVGVASIGACVLRGAAFPLPAVPGGAPGLIQSGAA
jgi:hypothetical protein